MPHHVPERTLSKVFLNSISLGDVTTFLGRLFHCPTTLWVKSLFLISSLNLSDTSSGHSLSPITGHHREEVSV